MGKDKAPADLTLKRVLGTRPYEYDQDRERVEHGDAAVFCIELWGGPILALVDTVFSCDDIATKIWFREMGSLARNHRLRAPLVAGLVALRGRAPSGSPWESVRARGHPQHPDNPIRCVVICVGGSHAIMYQPVGKDAGGVLAFEDKMLVLREFLGDGRVTVACLGAAEVTRKLAGEWGLHVARPAELTDLFARAHGDIDKIPGVEPWKVPGSMDSEDGEGHRSRLLPKAIDGVSIEYMARVALGPEMRLAPTPASVGAADWGGHDLTCNDWLYATRDAYLCFDIAAHCLAKLGTHIG